MLPYGKILQKCYHSRFIKVWCYYVEFPLKDKNHISLMSSFFKYPHFSLLWKQSIGENFTFTGVDLSQGGIVTFKEIIH